ncbi:MAG: isochorismatase family protein [Acidimicrobiia bacterium]|nr:isochorismatase family protein [Acidimicrobiia bacterium]MYF27215.1 isochorismatase family protein [Acidimicrobiia bacterium]
MTEYSTDTALVVVDVQNDFADPDGSLYVPEADTRIIPAVNRQVSSAIEAGASVFYTQDWHPERTPHFATDGGIWPVHCVAGTVGAEFHPDLLVEGPSVYKGANGEDGYSGFTMRDPVSGEEKPTELESMIRAAGCQKVVVVGLALDYCVKDTALDVARGGFETTVLLDATGAVNLEPGDGDKAVAELRSEGVTVG